MTREPNPEAERTTWRLWASLAVVVLFQATLFLAFSRFIPGTLGNWDSSAKVWQQDSLLDGHLDLTYPAKGLDPQERFIPSFYVMRLDGKCYSVYLNFFALTTHAATRLVGPIAWNLVSLLSVAVAVFAMMWMAVRHRIVPRRRLWLLLLVLGCCTPLAVYSLGMVEQPMASAFVAAAFLLATSAVGGAEESPLAPRLWRLAGAGACLAAAGLTRGECYLFGAALWLVLVGTQARRSPRRAAAMGLALFAGGAAVLAAWFTVFPWAWRAQFVIAEHGAKVQFTMLHRYYSLLVEAQPAGRVSAFLGPLGTSAFRVMACGFLVLGGLLSFFSGGRAALRGMGIALFLLGMFLVLGLTTLFGGLLAACPLLLVPLFARRRAGLPEDGAVRLIVWTAVLFAFLCGLLLPNASGSVRYLLPITMPLTVVAVGVVSASLGLELDRWLRALFILAAVAGFLINAKNAAQSWGAAKGATANDRSISALPAPVLILKDDVLYHSSRILSKVPCLQVDTPQQLDDVLAMLRKNGISTVAVISHELVREESLRMLHDAGIVVEREVELTYRGFALIVKVPPGPPVPSVPSAGR